MVDLAFDGTVAKKRHDVISYALKFAATTLVPGWRNGDEFILELNQDGKKTSYVLKSWTPREDVVGAVEQRDSKAPKLPQCLRLMDGNFWIIGEALDSLGTISKDSPDLKLEETVLAALRSYGEVVLRLKSGWSVGRRAKGTNVTAPEVKAPSPVEVPGYGEKPHHDPIRFRYSGWRTALVSNNEEGS